MKGCAPSADVMVVDSTASIPQYDEAQEPEMEEPAAAPTLLTIGEPERIRSLDPLFASNNAELRAIQLLYEGLTRLDTEGNPVAGHARSWEISDDSTTYTFHLRTDLYFHDSPVFLGGLGRRVSAFDFKRAFERTARPGVPAVAAGMFYDVIVHFDTYYNEQHEFNEHLRTLSEIPGIVAQNDSTLHIELYKPDAAFLQKLASPYAVAYPEEALRSSRVGLHKHPVGSGPFSAESLNNNEMLELERSPRYYASRDIPIQSVRIRHIPDENELMSRFSGGEIDYIPETGWESTLSVIDENGELAPAYRDGNRLLAGSLHRFYLMYNHTSLTKLNRSRLAGFAQSLASDASRTKATFPAMSYRVLIETESIEDHHDPGIPYNDNGIDMVLIHDDHPLAGGIAADIIAATEETGNPMRLQQQHVADRNVTWLLGYRRHPLNGAETCNNQTPVLQLDFPHYGLARNTVENLVPGPMPWWIDLRNVDVRSRDTDTAAR